MEKKDIELYKEIATIAVKSAIVEEGVEGVVMKIMLGRAFGLDPVQSMLGFDIIQTKQGKYNLFIKPRLLASRIKESNKYDYRVVKADEKECIIKFFEKRGSDWEFVGESRFTREEADKQGITKSRDGRVKDNWFKNPVEMLFYRCMSRGVSMFCPDVILGLPLYLTGVEEWYENKPKSAEEVDITSFVSENKYKKIEDDFNLYREVRQIESDSSIPKDQINNLRNRFETRLSNYGLNADEVCKILLKKPLEYVTIQDMIDIVNFLGVGDGQEPKTEVIQEIKGEL